VVSPAAKPAASPSPSPASSPVAKPSPAAQAAATADPALASAWQGKTVTLVVGQNPGGGNDTWARLVGRHIGKHLPGTPNVIVQNMPGGSHRVAANFVYAARPDGLTIGLIERSIPTFQLRGEGVEEGVRYDAGRFSYLGSAATETQVLVAQDRAGVTDGRQLEGRELRVAHTDPGGGPHVNHIVLREALGWQLRPFFGFGASAESLLAMERGDVDAMIISWGSLVVLKGDELRARRLIPLVQIGGGRIDDPLAAGVPAADDLIRGRGAEAMQLLGLAQRPFTWSRTFAAPPDMEPRMLATMRAAFMSAMQDPALLADAAQLQLEIGPVPGERIQPLIQEFLATPRPIVERLDQLIQADTPA
jgi:tripartite-type tricarboxylate transporter receptor subunit TctC